MAANQKPNTIQISWETGTGYDFLASLHVLHFPDTYGLRGAWAAGVRSRLSTEAREFLEPCIENCRPPLAWLHSLPEPKDATAILLALKRIPAAERLAAMKLSPAPAPELLDLLNQVSANGQWSQTEQDQLLHLWKTNSPEAPPTPERAAAMLDLYANPAESGRLLLESLQNYYEVFFAEEEKRIGEKLIHALDAAQIDAENQTPTETITTLTGRSHLDYTQVVLTPSYWHSPGAVISPIGPNSALILFGARSPEESLVPGETVPEDMLLRMKAMTDPTRLRILRYLLQQQMTPAELARRLRLRAPTVTHHLHTLKKAGMVNFIKKGKNEHLYFAKMETIKETYLTLIDFLEQDVKVVEGFDLFDNALF